jgi:hypothetical protein
MMLNLEREELLLINKLANAAKAHNSEQLPAPFDEVETNLLERAISKMEKVLARQGNR